MPNKFVVGDMVTFYYSMNVEHKDNRDNIIGIVTKVVNIDCACLVDWISAGYNEWVYFADIVKVSSV